MIEVDITALRRSVRLAHCVHKEKAITCSLLITKRGDVEFEHLEENADDRDPYFQAFHCYRKLTNASMEGLHEFMSEEHFEQYNSLLFMTRLIVGDEDSIEDLKSESNSLGYLSILMAQTFQSSLAQYNNLLGMILTQSVIPHRPFKATKIQTVDRSKISPFRMEKVVAEVLGHTQNTNKSTLTQPFSAFVTSCFSTLKALDESNQKISIDSDYYLISDSTIDKFDKYINSLFSLLVTIISLKESLQIEIMLLQQMALSESGDADRIFCSLLGNGSKPHPHVEALAKLFTIHHDYQENTITRIKKIANDIDLSTFKQKNTFFSAIVEECLIFSENLMEAQSIFGTPGNLGKGLGKILSNEKLTKLGIAHCDKLHGIELALIEELDNIQLIPDRKEQSPEQRKQQIMRKKLQNDFSESNVSIADSSLPSINPLNVPKNPFANMSPFETKKMIENMSPDLMKSTLLSLFNVESELSRSTPASTMDGKNSDNDDEEDASLPLDLVPVVSEWKVDLDELKFKKKIGNGGAGTTYLSKWRREDVAVKVAAATGLGRMGWKKELRYLKNLHHPNVIRMLGCVYSEDPFAMSIILEFCDKGDLGSLLNKSTPKNFFYTASLGLANGLAYLHHKGIIHRDIKPDNILVHGNFETGDIVVKVIDFGLSVFFDVNKYSNLRRGSESSCSKFTEQTYDEDHTEEAGTYRWMAPEVFRHEPYNFKVDQYSFAIVLWQLLTREKPYVDKEQEDAARLAAYDFQRPPIPKGTPKDVLSLIDRCWSEDPEDRPMFHDICDMIEKWNNTLTKSEQSWLNQGNGHPIYSKMKLSRSESMEERPTRRNSLFEKPRRRASGLLRMSMSFGIDKKKLEVDEPLTSSGRARASRSRSTIY